MRSNVGLLAALALFGAMPAAGDDDFGGVVVTATPEASAAGAAILEAGGNAVDAAVAASLALTVSEPAGSGIGGQTVMLIKAPGRDAVVVQGTTWSPRNIPDGVTVEQLRRGRTASTVPSTLAVLDAAHRRFGGGRIAWAELVEPAIRYAEEGVVIGPFRGRAFRFYGQELEAQPAAAAIFTRPDGSAYDEGERLRQPLLAATLRRIARGGARIFYEGRIAEQIARDMAEHGGWITQEDLRGFPEPAVVPAIPGTYRGFEVETLPPPFAGWVVLQALNVLELLDAGVLEEEDSVRRLALLDALRLAHGSRAERPVSDYLDYGDEVERKVSKSEAKRLLDLYAAREGGETTHFSIVDADGMAVSVTQSIDSYFGAKVVHPTLGFLYNNYMQGFQIEDPEAPYFLEEAEMPLSSMSATIVSESGRPVLALGSPGSARIISAVLQVVSHWIDVGDGIEAAVAAYRVHVVPPASAYVEGPELDARLLAGLAARGLSLNRPAYGVAESHLDPYYGGVQAVARQHGRWTGAADPRRDGAVVVAGRAAAGASIDVP